MNRRRRTRRGLLAGAVALLVAVTSGPVAAGAPKVRVGVLGAASEGFLRESLRERGWTEGENLVLEERYAEEGDLSLIPGLAADLVARGVAVLIAIGNTSTAAAQRATRTIPVVFLGSDPVERGFVKSLARPVGNLTGVAALSSELNVKRLEILHQAFPRITREDDFERAYAVLTRERAGALLPVAGPYFRAHQDRVLSLAARLRLPGLYEDRSFVEAGGLMAYGPDRREMLRRVASYVDQILKGARPADLPVEQVTRIEFVLNDKTARSLGLVFSPQTLSRADEVLK